MKKHPCYYNPELDECEGSCRGCEGYRPPILDQGATGHSVGFAFGQSYILHANDEFYEVTPTHIRNPPPTPNTLKFCKCGHYEPGSDGVCRWCHS